MKEILVIKAEINEKKNGYSVKFQTEVTRLTHLLKDEEIEKNSELSREINNIFSNAVKRNVEETKLDEFEEKINNLDNMTKEEKDELKEELLSSLPLDMQKELREFERRMEEEKDPLKRLDILFKQILKELSK